MLPKVIDAIARLENEKILDKQDIREIIDIYTKACDNEKIKAEFKNENILEKLHKKNTNTKTIRYNDFKNALITIYTILLALVLLSPKNRTKKLHSAKLAFG